jgi:hypothetical protein
MGRSGSGYWYVLPDGMIIKLVKKYKPKLKIDKNKNDNFYCECDSDTEYIATLEFNIDREDAKEIMDNHYDKMVK